MLSHFINSGCDTIAKLSKNLELSVPTITKFIGELHEQGLITEYGKIRTSEGRHPLKYGLNPTSAFFIGVDLSYNNLSIALMNFTGQIVCQEMNIPFVYNDYNETLNCFCEHLRRFMEQCNVEKEKIFLMNINIRGRVNPDLGQSFSSFDFNGKPIGEIVSEKIGIPVSIDNDSRSMAFGEFMQGCVDEEKNIIFVNSTWGLGIGIIIDGKPYYGTSGFSGEIGHSPVFDNEIICRCGKKGCLETEVSGMAIHRNVLHRIKEGASSIVTEQIEDLNELTLHHILDAINNEDSLCIEIVETVGRKLGRYLAGLINIFNPELVVIGGLVRGGRLPAIAYYQCSKKVFTLFGKSRHTDYLLGVERESRRCGCMHDCKKSLFA